MTHQIPRRTVDGVEDSDDERLARLRAERDAYQRELLQREEQLASQPQIEQAKGILMQNFALDAEDAFIVLVRISQQSNVKLRVIATQVVDRCQGQVSPSTAATVAEVIEALSEQLRD